MTSHDKTNTNKTHQETRSGTPTGFFVVFFFLFFSRVICLVLYFQSSILPNSFRQPSYLLSAAVGEVAELSPQMTREEHSRARCAEMPRRNQSPPKNHRTPDLEPLVYGRWERQQREEGRKPKKKVLVALSGEGVKKTNSNQQPTKDKHSTKKLQGKFKHWGPHSRKLVTWVTSWNFTAKYPFFFLIWKDKLLAFLNNFNMFNGWKLSSNCSAYWIKC